LFGLLLLIGTPVRPVKADVAHAGDAGAAISLMADDLQDDNDAGKSGKLSCDNNSGGMDDILHPFVIARVWAPLPSQPPASDHADVSQHDPASLLRPPEAA